MHKRLSAILALLFATTASSFSIAQTPIKSFSASGPNLLRDLPAPSCSFNCSSNDTSAPWNFSTDFSNSSWKTFFEPNSWEDKLNPAGWTPYEIIEDDTGNKFLAITVKDGMNGYKKSQGGATERAELQTKNKNIFGKEVWWGFRVKGDPDFKFVDDRLLITQLKVQAGSEYKFVSPVLSLHSFSDKTYDVAGQICPTSRHHYMFRSDARIANIPSNNGLKGCYKNRFRYEVDARETQTHLLNNDDWTTYKIGAFITNTGKGFFRVYKNGTYIYGYKGPTYGWKGSKYEGRLRIGLYRDSGNYPDQTLYFDDFVVGSKAQVDSFLPN